MKHILGFSGGVDSQTVALLLRKHYATKDIILLRSRAGENEHRITDQWVQEYSEKVFPIIEVVPKIKDIWETEGQAEKHGLDPNAKLDFLSLAKLKGRFPSKRAQFCTEVLKLRPQKRWIWENLTDGDWEMYSGVRCEEPGRYEAKPRYWDTFFDGWVNNPILDWKKQWCFDYILENGEKPNPLYELGFDRIGCAPCINAKSKDAILRWADRSPESIEKIRGWERETGWTYFAPMIPDMEKNFIDDVLLWARTSHGGRQFRILEERPSCESKYGLCE